MKFLICQWKRKRKLKTENKSTVPTAWTIALVTNAERFLKVMQFVHKTINLSSHLSSSAFTSISAMMSTRIPFTSDFFFRQVSVNSASITGLSPLILVSYVLQWFSLFYIFYKQTVLIESYTKTFSQLVSITAEFLLSSFQSSR